VFYRVVLMVLFFSLALNGWAERNIVPDTTAPDSTEIVLIGGRYVFMQSGFPVEKRTLQYQNLNGLVNDIQYGITDEITLAGGLVLPFYAYIAPQYSVEVAKNQRMIVGDVLTSSLISENDVFIRANLIYGGYTIGNIDNHATLAMGYLSTNRLPEGSLVFQFGGCKRLSERIFLLGEMWYSSGRQNMPQVNQWVYGSAGQRLLVDESNPLTSPFVLKPKDILVPRNSIYANVQFRLISTKNSNKSWSFGLMYFGNWGGEYLEHGPYGEVRKVNNLYNLPLPSISFIQRIGDFRPSKLKNPLRK